MLRALNSGALQRCNGAGIAPIDGEVDPVLIVAVAALAVGVDVHRHGADGAGPQAVAVLLVVLLYQDRIVRDASAMPMVTTICAARVMT